MANKWQASFHYTPKYHQKYATQVACPFNGLNFGTHARAVVYLQGSAKEWYLDCVKRAPAARGSIQ